MTDRYIQGVPAPVQPDGAKPEKPVREILVELWENTETLLRQEMKLASTELDHKLDRLKREATAVAIGGALLHAGVMALVAALILLLAEAVNPWIAALVVGVVLAGAGFFLVKRDPKRLAEDLVPERTIENVKKDVQTFREATK